MRFDDAFPSPRPRPSAQVWLPASPWLGHIRIYGARDTRGCGLDEAARHNHFVALPYCAMHWFLEGSADLVSIGGRRVRKPIPRWSVSGCFNAPVSTLNPGDVHASRWCSFPRPFTPCSAST